MKGMGGAVGIFTGIFDIDGKAREILQHDFACQARVTAGAARRDYQPLPPAQGIHDWLERLSCGGLTWNVLLNGCGKRLRLFVDLAQHSVRKNCGFRSVRRQFSHALKYSMSTGAWLAVG